MLLFHQAFLLLSIFLLMVVLNGGVLGLLGQIRDGVVVVTLSLYLPKQKEINAALL